MVISHFVNMIEYKGMCNQKIQKSFTSLNTYFTIILIFLGVGLGVFVVNTIIANFSPDQRYLYSDIFPPYVGIAVIILFVVVIYAIREARFLKQKICPKDGMSTSLLGGSFRSNSD